MELNTAHAWYLQQASGSSIANLQYCEICQVPCIGLERHCAGIKHKKKEKDLQERRVPTPILSKMPIPVKAQPPRLLRSLRDYMKDPNRDEPLIGLEYLVEIRYKGKMLPFYECQLCQFTTELTPMIPHLIGKKHRNYYLLKHHPDKAKKTPAECKEDKAAFLKRVAREVEKTEGLKMYKCEGFERPSKITKRNAKFAKNYTPENDPVQKMKALEYMEKFEITSDKEASVVINLAQLLSEDLKAFCKKQASLNHIKSLPSLLTKELGDVKQQTNSPFESYINHPGKSWDHGCPTKDFTELQSLQQPAPSTSSTPANPYAYQISEKVSSHGLSSQDLATMSALEQSFAHQPGGFGTGTEWMKQFNPSASAYFQSAPVKEKSSFSTSQSSYKKHYQEERQVSSNKNAVSRPRNRENFRDTHDSSACSLSPTLHPPPGRSQASFPSQKRPSYYHDVLDSGKKQMPARPLSSEKKGPYKLQQPYSKPALDHLGSHSSFSSGGLYEQQKTHAYDEIRGSRNVLTDDILSQPRKSFSYTKKHDSTVASRYPGLQNADIYDLPKL